MPKKRCHDCKKWFPPKTPRQRFCGPTCQHRDWVKNNKQHMDEYQREWIQGNPEARERYNAKKRRGWDETICKRCKSIFRRTSSQSKYCTAKCREKARMLRPGEREKASARSVAYANKNKSRVRVWYRTYYPGYAKKKMTAQPWSTLLTGAKRRAKIKHILFDLTPEWAAGRWTGYCELTGLPFSGPDKRVGYKNRNMSPSIDRINPAGPYTQNNCRIILWAVNCFKRDSSDTEMYEIANALINTPRIDASIMLALPS